MIRGYARALAGGPTVFAQIDRLRAAGADIVYRETDAETRVALAEMIDHLFFGDVVLVTRLDHLADVPEDFALIVAAIVEAGARFHSLRWAERHRGDLLPGAPPLPSFITRPPSYRRSINGR